MGVANVIPGVSGGTIAVVTGIYERLIHAIKSFDPKAMRLLLKFDIKGVWQHVDGWFLMALGLGGVVSVVSVAKLLGVLLEHSEYQVYVSALFFGLILASVWSVCKMVKKWSVAACVGLVLGCLVAVSLVFLPQAQEDTGMLYLVFCGVIAMCSMIIPGVSGSFVLLLMGNYKLIMVDSINTLSKGKMEALSVLIPVGVGAVLGLAVLSRFLSWVFQRFYSVSLASIAGFILGSLVTIWPWKRELVQVFEHGDVMKEKVVGYSRYAPDVNTGFWLVIGVMLLGVVIMLGVDAMGKSRSR